MIGRGPSYYHVLEVPGEGGMGTEPAEKPDD